MLQITVPETELWDELNEVFVYTKEQTLRLEHSLVSLSKWESKWKKPFLTNDEKTDEETIDYIRCMTINRDVDPDTYQCITRDQIDKVIAYIEDSMTATTFSNGANQSKSTINGEQITAELLYYYMIESNIPFECQKWHLNRLITLIRVVGIKRSPAKKMSPDAVRSQQARLNAERRKKYNTKG